LAFMASYPRAPHGARASSAFIIAVRTASHFLYGSVSANSLAIIIAGLVLAIAGSVAALIPARRAAFADPLESFAANDPANAE
jgi:ABC-type antimicrobial peptide transport system permease subunit